MTTEMGTKNARANGLKVAETLRNAYAIDVPPETTQSDLERPTFWMHDAKRLNEFDRIEVRWEDGQKWADCLVTSKGVGFARIHVLHFMDRASVAPVNEDEAATAAAAGTTDPSDDGLVLTYVKYRGPSAKWSVIRKADDHVVKERLADKITALIEAAQYEKAVAA